MNTKQEQENEPPRLIDLGGTDAEAHSQVVRALSSAQEEIADLKDKRLEERFAWIVILVMVIDCFLFLSAENWAGPIVIGLIQMGALSVLAARMGVEEFATLFKGAFMRMTDIATKGD